jgi:hypothetical protein
MTADVLGRFSRADQVSAHTATILAERILALAVSAVVSSVRRCAGHTGVFRRGADRELYPKTGCVIVIRPALFPS